MQEVTLADVQQFYQKVFLKAQNRQQILVQVQGEKFRNSARLAIKDEILVNDVDLLPK